MKLAIVLALAVFTYHFNEKVTGNYPREKEGTVLVAGSQWRIGLPGTISSAEIGGEGRDTVAINDRNQTWFPLHSRMPMPIGGLLFSYPMNPEVSKIDVAFADGAKTRLAFSYDLTMTIAGEKVRGRVWGEMRISTRGGGEKLPWSPTNIKTGLDDVDAAFRSQLAQIEGQVWKSETEVSRRIENGETLHQVITRTISDLSPSTAKPEMFHVPAGYREQPPVIGVPGK
ncbi:MAG TPA: hypothetical protein VGJ88_05575 [Thermoanaerobaculia bacterium]